MRVAYVHPVIIPVIIGTIGVQQLKTIIRALPRSSRGPVMPQLINPRTGQVIEPGTKIHTVQGGHAWRFERLRKVDHHEHHVHVTKIVKGTRGRTFRGHREFHPSVFGLDVKIDITWSRHVVNTGRHMLSKIDDYLWAGAFAIIPLAFFEHYHMSGTIIETVTLGMLGGGGH